MGWTLADTSTGTGFSGATCNYPAGRQVGDLLVAVASASLGATDEAGWTTVGAASLAGANVRFYWRIEDGTGSSMTTGGSVTSIAIAAFRTDLPPVVTGQEDPIVSGTSQTSFDLGPITTATNDALLVIFDGYVGASTNAVSAPGFVSAENIDNIDNTGAHIAYDTQATAGSTGTVTATCSSSTHGLVLMAFEQSAPTAHPTFQAFIIGD